MSLSIKFISTQKLTQQILQEMQRLTNLHHGKTWMHECDEHILNMDDVQWLAENRNRQINAISINKMKKLTKINKKFIFRDLNLSFQGDGFIGGFYSTPDNYEALYGSRPDRFIKISVGLLKKLKSL